MSGESNPICVSNGIVFEWLTRENYSTWSTLVQNYLMGEGLWDGVTEGEDRKKQKPEEEKKSEMANRKALHVIQVSCGNDALSEIRNVKSAREAWNQLKTSYSENLKAQRDPAQTKQYDESASIQSWVKRGFMDDVWSRIHTSPDVIFQRSDIDGTTVLHAVVSKGLKEPVTRLVNLGGQRLLKMRDKDGYTALALAAELTNDTDLAKSMVEKGGEGLVSIKTEKGEIPVVLAATNGHKEMTEYLYSITPPSILAQNNLQYLLFSRCISTELFNVAAAILEHHPDADLLSPNASTESNQHPIYDLARKRSAFRSSTHLTSCQQFIYKSLMVQTENIPITDRNIEIVIAYEPEDEPTKIEDSLAVSRLRRFFGRFWQFVQTSILLKISGIREIYEMKMKHHLVLKILQHLRARSVSDATVGGALSTSAVDDAMLQAAKNGIYEFIKTMAEANPQLLFVEDSNNRGLLSHAIMNRHEKLLKFLIHNIEKYGTKDIMTSSVDVFQNNMLHLAAELGPSTYLNQMPNAALMMQRETQWFKEIKNIVPSSCYHAINREGQLPEEIFSKTHDKLLKDAQQWAKDTSSSFTLVGTLIITIMFAAAFTVPGGFNSENDTDKLGLPVFLGEYLFNLFIIADAISLVTSSSAVLLFIGILTSRYAEEDFYISLPLKLLFGLLTLFFSVASMMTAFCAALALMLKGYHQIVIAAMWLTIIPVMVFVPSLVELFVQLFSSTIKSVIIS